MRTCRITCHSWFHSGPTALIAEVEMKKPQAPSSKIQPKVHEILGAWRKVSQIHLARKRPRLLPLLGERVGVRAKRSFVQHNIFLRDIQRKSNGPIPSRIAATAILEAGAWSFSGTWRLELGA